MHKTIVGLEIHVELNTNSKMFCSCKNDPDEKSPNLNICPICMGHPGTLPVINKEAVRKVIRTALALNCEIQKRTHFERKNYFYPDLPKGYQISQYAAPIAGYGYLEIFVKKGEDKVQKSQISNLKSQTNSKTQNPNSGTKKIRLRRVHLEEDTGRLIHPEEKDYSLVDFNRAGIPLMELVTEPDIHSSREVSDFVRHLQLILRYLGVSEANMEKGEMRCEVNISLLQKSQIPNPNPPAGGQINSKFQIQNSKLGTKVEIKNLNSLRAVEKAIEYETRRQGEILEKGGKIIQETRGWDDKKEITFSQREKEESQDYRYFPEPDLPPLKVTDDFLNDIKSEIPELPESKRRRFKEEYNVSDKEIELYISHKDLGEYFEKVVSELEEWIKTKRPEKEIEKEDFKSSVKLASNYISTDLQGLLKGASVQGEDFLITPENFAEFVSIIQNGEISSKIAKLVLKEMFRTGADPSQVIEAKGLQLITNQSDLENAVKKVIENNQKAVNDYKKGKEATIQFLVGQVMAQTKGKAAPETVQRVLRESLKS